MKNWILFLLLATPAAAQSPDAAKYAPRPILLLDATPGVEAVMPMVFSADGQQHLEFIEATHIKEAMDKGGLPIRLGDVMSALADGADQVSKLKSENDKLWQVAMKSTSVTVEAPPQQSGPTPEQIAAQEREQRRNTVLMMMLGNSLRRPSAPYVIPDPAANRMRTSCTTSRLGDMLHTSCN